MVVEEVAHERPDGEVQARGGWDPRHGPEDDGQVHLADETVSLVPAVEPEWDGEDGTQWEAPDEGTINGIGTEEFTYANDAPENGPIEVNTGNGTGEAVDSLRCAQSSDVGKHPVQHTDLCQ